MDYIITTENLTRKFGPQVAVKDASLHIKKGEIYGLIGRNGAGKTTILKMVGGLIRPTSGKIEFEGEPIDLAISNGHLAKVGSLIEIPGLQNGMTGHDNLRMKCICAGIPDDDAYIHGLLEQVGIADAEFKKAGNYSLGMRQRLGIALALVGDPEVLLLDEPINGLDPQGIVEVRECLLKLNHERNMTILISSHILEELSKLATTFGVIDKGELLREFSREEMEQECISRVIIRTTNPAAAVAALKASGLTEIRVEQDGSVIVKEGMDDTPSMVRTLTAAGVDIREIFLGGQSLEDFFFSIVGGAKNA